MFKIGDYITHPMHGAGVIESIVTKKLTARSGITMSLSSRSVIWSLWCLSPAARISACAR